MGNVKIKQFSDKNKELIAGLTPEHAVYDVKGVRLDAKIGSILDIKNTVDTQGKNLDNLTLKVNALAVGIFYGYRANESELPQDIIENGYAYVGTDNPYKIYNFDGTQWKDSGTTIQATSEADEEDITYNENDKLTFRDRDNMDGMGYVILRKNKSFAEQVTKENTIYEIRYEFDLNNIEFNLPSNCVFKFNGGTLLNTNFVGILSNTYVCPEWFGAKGDGVADDTNSFLEALKQKTIVCKNNAIYNIRSLYLSNLSNVTIYGNNSTLNCISTDASSPFNVIGNSLLSSRETNFVNGNFYIENIEINGNVQNYIYGESNTDANSFHLLALDNFNNVIIKNCTFRNSLMCGIKVTICNKVLIDSCSFYNIGCDEGNFDTSIGNWQWECVSALGYRNVNGIPSNRVYKTCESVIVKNSYIENCLNSVLGSCNYFVHEFSDNICKNLHFCCCECHIDDPNITKLDKIQINGNTIDNVAGGFLSFSNKFDLSVRTKVIIKDNILKNRGAITLPKYHLATESGMRMLLQIFDSYYSKSNIHLMYINNTVIDSDDSITEGYITLNGVGKAIIKDSIFSIKSSKTTDSYFYIPRTDIEIINCKFDIQTSYQNFISIPISDNIIIKDTLISNAQDSHKGYVIWSYRESAINIIKLEGLVIGNLKYLTKFYSMPKHLTIINCVLDGNLGSPEPSESSGINKSDSIFIMNNVATGSYFNETHANFFINKYNTFNTSNEPQTN